MIDFIKAIVQDIDINQLKENKYLNFCSEVNLDTGEVREKNRNSKTRSNYSNAFFYSLEFRIYDSGKVFLLGSLHKYYNQGQHNYNDFGIIQLNDVLKDLKEKFNIIPEQLKINQIEIGVNIKPPCPVNKILQYCFRHRKEPLKWIAVSDEGKYKQSEYQQYFIKLYNKAQHYRKKGLYVGKDEILRFEIKYRKLERLKKFKIETLQDILSCGLDILTDELFKEWEQILFYDWTIQSDSKLLSKYCNPLFWDEVINNQPLYKKHKHQLNNLINNYSENIAHQIKEVMQSKVKILLNEGIRINQDCKSQKINKGIRINPLYIQLKQIPDDKKVRFCKVTHVCINMQREDSLLLSHTGLRYYYENDSNTFNSIKNKFLSIKWINADIELQIKEIAHNIRNKANNYKNRYQKLYPQDQLKLFH